MEKFKQLKLSEGILRAIQEANFKEPSKIQEKAIPPILEGKDVLGSSATGSGKTLAFAVGIIEKTRKGEGVQALILTPTRELAEQDALSLRKFSKYYNLRIKEIYGGVSIERQIQDLKNSEIVVGTPGRILDHLNRRTLNLKNVKFLVLDEADRMLDMGFIHDVEKIIHSCPKDRQTLLFSATLSSDIERLAKNYMRSPEHISVDSYVDPSKLLQVFYDVPQQMKFSLLAHMLKQEKKGLVMIFTNTRRNTDLLARNLKRYGVNALAIHGGLAQNRRNSIMKSFHSQQVFILVCTDVAARGLDIQNVSHVYNYDIPKTSGEYIHRIGRTARAGKEGKAISLVSLRDYPNFRRVCEDKSLKIDNEPLPFLEKLDVNFTVHSFGNQRRFMGWNKNRTGRHDGGRFNREGNRNPRHKHDFHMGKGIKEDRGHRGEEKRGFSRDYQSRRRSPHGYKFRRRF